MGGRLRGRRFPGPPGNSTRPTAERTREAVASALMARGAIEDARVLDLYAGTGALAFEALSRGARRASLVERDARVARALSASAESLGLSDEVQVFREDLNRERAFQRLAQGAPGPYELVFADPPYADLPDALQVLGNLAKTALLAEGAVVVLEHASKATPDLPEPFEQLAHYRYGDSAITLFEVSSVGETPGG